MQLNHTNAFPLTVLPSLSKKQENMTHNEEKNQEKQTQGNRMSKQKYQNGYYKFTPNTQEDRIKLNHKNKRDG